MHLLDSRVAFACHTRWLALTLEALLLLTLFSGAIPFELAQPVWWLRLSDAAVTLAPLLLLAVLLLRLGSILINEDEEESLRNDRRSLQISRRWVLIFVLLLPTAADRLRLALGRQRQPDQPPDQSG